MSTKAFRSKARRSKALLARAAYSPFPQRQNFSIKYGDCFNLAGGSGVVVQSFRLNSLYDPDITGVGGQPRYYTELAAVYGRYKVRAVDISVQFINNAEHLCMVGFAWSRSPGTPLSSITEIQQVFLEGNSSVSKTLIQKGSFTPSVTLTKHLDLALIEGCALDDVYEGDFGGNPLANIGLDVCAIDSFGVNDQAVQAIVQITYHGEVYALRTEKYID